MADHPTDSSDAPESVEASGASVEEALRQALRQLDATIDDVDVEILSSGGSRLLRRDAEARVRVVRRERPFSATIDEWSMSRRANPRMNPRHEPPSPASRRSNRLRQPRRRPNPWRSPSRSSRRPAPARLGPWSRAAKSCRTSSRICSSACWIAWDSSPKSSSSKRTRSPTTSSATTTFSKLIGRHGSTLRSFGYLINLMAGRQLGQPCRVLIDVNSYRARRADHLRELAETLADEVIETQEPVTLESMPANERRLIHVALADDENVRTYSIGEGDERRVVISPRA